jgi:hypothetical protein
MRRPAKPRSAVHPARTNAPTATAALRHEPVHAQHGGAQQITICYGAGNKTICHIVVLPRT